MAVFDRLTRRHLLGLAGVALASPLLMSLPRSSLAANEHAGHAVDSASEPAGSGDFIRLDEIGRAHV